MSHHYQPSPQRHRLQNEPHDEVFNVESSNASHVQTPETFMMQPNNNNSNKRNFIPRPASPTPTSSDADEEESSSYYDTDATSENEDQYYEDEAYYRYQQARQQQARQQQNAAGANSTRPASPPSKQSSVPRAHSSRSAEFSPNGAQQALRQLDESMDQLCDNFPDTSSSSVNSALNEVCDKLELLSEIVLSHERRLKNAETSATTGISPVAAASARASSSSSPFSRPVHDGVSSPSYLRQAEENRTLVNSILAKVDAVENMMQQHAVGMNMSPSQQKQQQQVRSPLASLPIPSAAGSANRNNNNNSNSSNNQENITPARSEASNVIAATVESAMKSISRQLARQNELLAQVVVHNTSPAVSQRQSPVYVNNNDEEDPLAQSTTASIADECSPQGAELSPRRERTPEALAATCSESAKRQLEAMREASSPQRQMHVDPNYVVPPARLYEEYDYSGTEDDEAPTDDYTETDATEETEGDNISVDVNDVQEDDGAYYYDRIRQQKKLHENSYNVPLVGAGADIVSVTSSQFDDEVEEEEGDNSSPRRAMYGAVDSVASIRAVATSPARNRGVIQAPQAVVFENDDDETEDDDYTTATEATETDDDDDMVEMTDTEDDEEQIRVAEHFSPSRRTPQAYATTAAEMARRDEEELIATLRAKQQTQAYLEESVMRSAERRRREEIEANSPTAAGSSSPASRASTASRHNEDRDHPSTGRHPNESMLVEVEGLTPQPAYLLRSAIRNDAEVSEQQPEKRVLFTEDVEDDENESVMTQEEDFVSVQKTSTTVTPSDMSYATTSQQDDSQLMMMNNSDNNQRGNVDIYSRMMMMQQQQQQQESSTSVDSSSLVSTAASDESTTVVPNDLLQSVLNELHGLRQENKSLKNQLDWALKRTDAVSERLLELSPCK